MTRSNQRMPHVGTIGSTARVGHSITVNCGKRDCRHRATLDLGRLRASLGDEYPIASLVLRSVCSGCGSRWPQLLLTVSPARPRSVGIATANLG
jgi:hypothetical protein